MLIDQILNPKKANNFQYELKEEHTSLSISISIIKNNIITIPLVHVSPKKIRHRDENFDQSNKSRKREILKISKNLKLNSILKFD